MIAAPSEAAFRESAAYIAGRLTIRPELCIVLGSGLGCLTEEMTDRQEIAYTDIPHFPRPTVPTHAGRLVAGRLAGQPVLAMSGRFHYYEGHSFADTAYYVRVMHLLGIRRLIVTNAAGGVNPDFAVGELMLISDHLKFFSDSPARGTVPPMFGSRFFDMSAAYTPSLRELARRCAEQEDVTLREGVYAFMPGPQFETPAEVRALRLLGADAVGMSTVPEVIAAAQCGMEVLGISCITNPAAGTAEGLVLSDEDVNLAAGRAGERFRRLVRSIVAALPAENQTHRRSAERERTE